MKNKIDYKEPGEGAVEFAQSFTGGLNIFDAMPVIKQVMNGELHDTKDKRIKRCDHCKYLWRDASLRNTKRTCCEGCKRSIKSLQRRQQRADVALLNPKPKKKTKREEGYIWWLEYPFWIQEYEMLKHSWKYENPYSPRKVELIDAAKQRGELNGGKRKPKHVVPYNGNEKETGNVRVKFTNSDRKPGEVIVSYMSPEELLNYYSGKYSERHLRNERMRAQGHF